MTSGILMTVVSWQKAVVCFLEQAYLKNELVMLFDVPLKPQFFLVETMEEPWYSVLRWSLFEEW